MFAYHSFVCSFRSFVAMHAFALVITLIYSINNNIGNPALKWHKNLVHIFGTADTIIIFISNDDNDLIILLGVLLTATSFENMLLVCRIMELKFRTVSNSNVISTGLPAMPSESLRQPTHS